MQQLLIKGKSRLGGIANVHGAKNSALPILAAAVLVKGESVIHNCPRLSDVEASIKILEHLGAKVKWQNDALVIDTNSIVNFNISKSLMQEMRSSIIFMGALLSRCGRASLYLPGGCEIGLRPIDLHLKGLSALGYKIMFDGCNIVGKADRVRPCKIVLPFPSVGATENLILATVLSKGKTTIVNSAREPEIVDLCNFLNSAGAKIKGASTTVIEIDGVDSLHSVEHEIIPDRILAATLMSAAAITSSELILKNVSQTDLLPVIPIFDEMGCQIFLGDRSIRIKSPKRLKRVRKIETQPYPGFPTDCQAPIMSALTLARGTSIINETIFEGRYKHITELNRFGADISLNDRLAIINGVKGVHGASAKCTDLRGGAAVVIEALAAEGESLISDIHHIDRGYERIENQLSLIGADIKRINNEKESTKEQSSTKKS